MTGQQGCAYEISKEKHTNVRRELKDKKKRISWLKDRKRKRKKIRRGNKAVQCNWLKKVSKTTPESSQKESVLLVKCHWDIIEQGETM